MNAAAASTVDAAIQHDFFAARRGDREAYARLVGATQRMVTSVALAVTRDVQLSEDIAQETFLTAWQRIDQMKQPKSFLPWLRQVARNRAIDHQRMLRYREITMDHGGPVMVSVATSEAGPDQALGNAQDAAVLARAMDAIPVDSREILLLFYREGQSSRDVAALLGMSDAAVRKRLQRARASLHGEVLSRLGKAAENSAPGVGFTALVTAGLTVGPGTASASGFGVGTLLKATPKILLGSLGALFASVALVVVAVFVEVRTYVARARNGAERRALLHNGTVYAGLMATYMVVLWWSGRQDWTGWQVIGAGVAFSIAIVLLAMARRRILKRGRDDQDR